MFSVGGLLCYKAASGAAAQTFTAEAMSLTLCSEACNGAGSRWGAVNGTTCKCYEWDVVQSGGMGETDTFIEYQHNMVYCMKYGVIPAQSEHVDTIVNVLLRLQRMSLEKLFHVMLVNRKC